MSNLDPAPPSVPAELAAHNRRSRRWIGWVGPVIMVAGVVGWAWWQFGQGPPRPMPVVQLGRVGPAERSAIKSAQALVLKKPRSGVAWGRLGMVLLAHNFEEAAMACFAAAQEVDPRTSSWPYYAGVALAISDPENALLQFARAAELAPDESWPKFRRAELLMDLERLEEADQILQTITGHYETQRLNYDQVRLALLQGPEALRKLQPGQVQPLQSGSNRRACLELLAQVWRRLGRIPQAEAITKKLQADTGPADGWDDPYIAEVMSLRKDPQWQAEVARQAFEAGQTDDAVQRMTQLVADYPDDPQWSVQLARMWMQLTRRGNAVSVLGEATQRHPNSAEVHFELGNLQFQLEDWSAAVASYATATKLKPDYGLAHYNLGQSHLKLGYEADASKAFRDALRCQPDLAEAHVNLADLLLRSGKSEDLAVAREHLEQAVKLAPQDRRAAELLKQLPKP